jgi:N-acetylglutamate synthase-like GNAT family acetyltransferase
MGLKVIDHGTNSYKQMVALRYLLLREPLGLSFSKEELAREKDDILIAAFDEEELMGCCVLSKIDGEFLRLRQMAVGNSKQGRGIGESILNFAENIARDKGYKKIMMHARNTAISFYEKFGYEINSPEFIEVGLPHHIMQKNI